MRLRIEREPFGTAFGARRRPVIALTAILCGCWTALGLTPSSAALAEPRQSSSLAPAEEAKKEVKKEEPTRSVWDGVYTEDQAMRGRSIFRTQCADCHKPDEFKMGFRTANDIFSSSSDMPQSSPDSLSAQEYADLIAYIFEANGLPSGNEELKGDPEILNQIRIDAEKPSPR